MPKKSRKQKTPKATREAIQVSQRKRANNKKAFAKAHGERCYIVFQHADKRSQRTIKQHKFARVNVDDQFKNASFIDHSNQIIADEEKKITASKVE